MVILLRHINAALPHSFAVIATHLLQVPWIWGIAVYWDMTSTPVTPNRSDSLHVVHLSLLVRQKKIS